MTNRLKIAIQKSGRLHDDSLSLLRECGIKIDNGRDQLRASSSQFPIDVFYLRNSDIPQYVEDGVADIAIVGENLLIEKQKTIQRILPLGFSKCRVSIAVPKNVDYVDYQYLNGKKIATSYPNTLQQFLDQKNLQSEIHYISGSVEIAPNIGLADAICDIVSSGSTLFKNGLEEKEIILKSQACLVRRKEMSEELTRIFDKLVFRINAVLAARNNKYLLMNVPNVSIDKVLKVLPGMKSPTIMPLAEKGWSSIHTVITEDRFWDIIEELKAAGAQGILIIPIQKMIL